jgi:hypothetical protein
MRGGHVPTDRAATGSPSIAARLGSPAGRSGAGFRLAPPTCLLQAASGTSCCQRLTTPIERIGGTVGF